jgi:quercetin dioxygenase-like cupin family protein
MSKDRVFITNADGVQFEDLARNGAENVKVRYLIDERYGSNHFSLRLYSVERGGHTPLDQHDYEHQVYILGGGGQLRGQGENGQVLRAIHVGDAIFIPSNAVHQFINERDEPLVFLCVKGSPTLYSVHPPAREQTSAPGNSTRNVC